MEGSGEEEGTSSQAQQNGAVGENQCGRSGYPVGSQEALRDVKGRYRELLNSVKETGHEMSSDGLHEVLHQASILYSHGSLTGADAQLRALDAQILVIATDLFKEKANQLCVEGNSFDTSVFAEHLLNFMGLNRLVQEDEENGGASNGRLPKDAWHKLAKRAQCCFKTAPTFHYMMGTFVTEPPPPKERVERQRKAPTKEAVRTMPAQLKQMEESHQEATEKEVERILGFLKSYHADDPTSPISYYEFVIDPTSFSRSVENMFHTSFLLRDGLARMYLDTNKLPCIAPVEEDHGDDGESALRKQCIMSISMQSWRDIIQAFEITVSMIPENTPNVK